MLVCFAAHFAKTVVEAVSELPKATRQELKWVFLLTDNFLPRDVEDFSKAIEAKLHLKTYRFSHADWVRVALIDMIVASRASVLMHNKKASYFMRFIREERILQGRPDNTTLLVSAPAPRGPTAPKSSKKKKPTKKKRVKI